MYLDFFLYDKPNQVSFLFDDAENSVECVEHYTKPLGFSNQEKNKTSAVKSWAKAEVSIKWSGNASFAQEWEHYCRFSLFMHFLIND